jgi:hypothetical protein
VFKGGDGQVMMKRLLVELVQLMKARLALQTGVDFSGNRQG